MVGVTTDRHRYIFFMKQFQYPGTWICGSRFFLIDSARIYFYNGATFLNDVNGFFYFILIPKIRFTKKFSIDVFRILILSRCPTMDGVAISTISRVSSKYLGHCVLNLVVKYFGIAFQE